MERNEILIPQQIMVFNPAVFYYGRPVWLTGCDEEGEDVSGGYLVKGREAPGDYLKLLTIHGHVWSLPMSYVTDNLVTIKPLGGDLDGSKSN